jgi:hypothetical protein
MTSTAHNKQNTDAPFVDRELQWSLNAVAHELVFANHREKIGLLIAAVGSSSLSSQQHCGVLLDVIRHVRQLPSSRWVYMVCFLERTLRQYVFAGGSQRLFTIEAISKVAVVNEVNVPSGAVELKWWR